MSLIEIVLIILGAIVLIISYLLPAGKYGRGGAADAGVKIDEGLIRGLVEKEVREEKDHIKEMVDETLTYSMEKTERAMERLSNEKIMAVNEYSEQVLESINKNHQEVIFLYDMLNDKHDSFVSAVSEASKKMKEIRQEIQDIEITVKDAAGLAKAPEQKETRQEKAGPEQEDREEKAGEENSFVPITPKKEVDLNRILQEVKVSENGGGAVQQKKEMPMEGQSYNNNEKILRLHKLGKSQTAIAKDLGLGIGEVKLVIDLYEQAK